MKYPVNKPFWFLISFVLVSLAVPVTASADVLLTNKPWHESGGICFGNLEDDIWQVGAQFTVGPHPVRFDSVEAKFHDPGDDSVFHASLYSNGDDWDWGDEIASLGSGSAAGEFPELEFFPGDPVMLRAHKSYWVVVSVPGEDGVCTGAWPASPSPNEGLLEYNDTLVKQGGKGSFRPVQIEINGDAQVAPIPSMGQWGLLLTVLLLAASGGLMARRLS